MTTTRRVATATGVVANVAAPSAKGGTLLGLWARCHAGTTPAVAAVAAAATGSGTQLGLASLPRSVSGATEVTETPEALMDSRAAPRTCRWCKAAFRGGTAVWAYCTTCDEPVCSQPCHLSDEEECAWPTDSSSSSCCRSRSGSSSDNRERGTDPRGNSLPPVCGHRPRGSRLPPKPQGPCLVAERRAQRV